DDRRREEHRSRSTRPRAGGPLVPQPRADGGKRRPAHGFDRRARATPRPLGPRRKSRTRKEHVMGSLSIWHWLIVLAIVVLIFGTKRLRGAGGDLGGAVKNFKDAMREGEKDAVDKKPDAPADKKPDA